MTTLAQKYVERGIPDNRHAEIDPFADEMSRRVHATVLRDMRDAPITEQAERFVFSRCPTDIVKNLIATRQVDHATMMEITRPPCQPCWLEFPVDAGHEDSSTVTLGVYVMQTQVMRRHELPREGTLLAYVMDLGLGYAPSLFGALVVPKMPVGTTHEPSWVDVLFWPDTKRLQDAIPHFIQDAIDAMFLLCIPRAAELRPHVPSARLQRRRAATGKKPLIEYKYVDLKIGAAQPRRSQNSNGHSDLTSASRESPRLHHVIGHVRTYRKDRETPKLTFVPDFWRGDATRGVVIHTHNVKEKSA
jgi:hypothetical protein